jgi:hypothetical protein
VNRRKFCYSMVALPGAMSAASMLAVSDDCVAQESATQDGAHKIRFVLNDPLEHPFYWWPRTLLSYPIEFQR